MVGFLFLFLLFYSEAHISTVTRRISSDSHEQPLRQLSGPHRHESKTDAEALMTLASVGDRRHK